MTAISATLSAGNPYLPRPETSPSASSPAVTDRLSPVLPAKSVSVTLSAQAQALSQTQKTGAITAAAPANYSASAFASWSDDDWKNLAKSTTYAPFNVIGSASEVTAILDRMQLAPSKVLAITLTDLSPLSISAKQLADDAATLKKITGSYSLTVSGVLMSKATSTAATKLTNGSSVGTVTSMSLSDTSAGFSAANIAAVQKIITGGNVAVTSMTQTDSASGLISLTAKQVTDNAGALATLDSAAKIAVTSGVAFANREAVLALKNVVSVSVDATKADIAGNLSELKTKIAAGKLTGIAVTGTDTAFSMSAADVVNYSSVFQIMSGAFSLKLTDATLKASDLAAMGSKSVAALASPLKVGGTAAEVSAVMDRLNSLGAKVTELSVSDQASNALSLTAAQLTASTATLKKLAGAYTMNVTEVKATDVTKVLAVTNANAANKSAGTVLSVAVSDTAAKLTTALTTLGASLSKITKISQTDPSAVISMTAAQMTTNAAVLAKFDQSVKVNVTGVAYGDITATLAKANVASVGLSVASTDVSSHLQDLKALVKANQISTIALTGTTNSFTLAANDIADNAEVLAKISSKFTVTLSSSTITASQAVKMDAATLKLLPAKAKLSISGSGADIKANLDAIQTLVKAGKVDGLSITGDGNLTLNFAETNTYAATLGAIKFGKVTTQFSGSSSQYAIVQGAGGAFTITDKRSGVTVKESGTVKGVNFFKFSDMSLFASSGDSNVDAVLNGGQNMWWYNGAGAAPSTTVLGGNLTTLASGSSKTTLSYSFLTPGTVKSNDPTEIAMTEMTIQQKQAVRDAFAYLSSLINVSFQESTDSGNADINFGMNKQNNVSAGYANPPHAGGSLHPDKSYLFLASDQASNNSFELGTYGWETLIHEIGHTMGLKHPFNGNAGGGGALQPYLPTDTNNHNFSVMSYTDAKNMLDFNVSKTGSVKNPYSITMNVVNPSTYMTYDIAALQYLYGQNLSQTSTKVVFDAGFKGLKTIYAPVAGEIDASTTKNGNIFDLRGGGYSTIGFSKQDMIDATKAKFVAAGASDAEATSNATGYVNSNASSLYTGLNTVGLAYGSRITSVKGGSGKDQFYVNGKDDVTIDGGAGSEDTVYLAGSASDWTNTATQTALSGTTGTLSGDTVLTNGTETVTLKNVEKFAFYALTDSLVHKA